MLTSWAGFLAFDLMPHVNGVCAIAKRTVNRENTAQTLKATQMFVETWRQTISFRDRESIKERDQRHVSVRHAGSERWSF